MNVPKLPFKFPDFVKYPLQAVMYILLAYFVYKEFTDKDECKELRLIVARQDIRIAELERSNAELVNNLLVKNGIIDRVTVKLDSIEMKRR